MKLRRSQIKRLAGLLLAFLAGILMLRWFEHSQVYHPGRDFAGSGSDLGRPFDEVWFQASDGVKLNGWFFPADTNSTRAHLVVLLCHGNAGNISHRLGVCQALLETGVNVFLFDYRGYGRSQGRPSEEGTYRDAQAAHQWLQHKGYPGRNILAFGESLGGGVGSELALREPLGGVVLQSTFTSVPDLGAELFPWLPVRWLSTIRYQTLAKLPRLKIPVLIMHSRTDELIAFHHGERNFDAANQPKLFWELKGEHNDPLAERQHFIDGINKFLPMVQATPLVPAVAPATPPGA